MLQRGWLNSSLYFSLYLVAFAIPFPFIAGSISVILFTILWICQADFRATIERLKGNKVLLIWLAFYLVHLLSAWGSDNVPESLRELESKLSFLVLPIVLGAGIAINRDHLERTLLSFSYGITAVALLCLAQACYRYSLTGDNGYFFYHTLVEGFSANAVYMAWYCITSISILVLLNRPARRRGSLEWLRWSMILIQFTFFILLSSKSLLLYFFVFLIPLYYLTQLKNYRLPIRLLVIGSALLIAGSITLSNNPISDRYKEILADNGTAKHTESGNHPRASMNNLTMRLFLWESGIKVLQNQNLWLSGVGVGDAHEQLNRQMYLSGISDMYTPPPGRSDLFNINLHNMYLQTLFMMGIGGLLLFLIIILSPFVSMIKKRDPNLIIFFIFHFTALLFMMQESALQTQAGVIFFTFFSMLFWNQQYASGHTAPTLFSRKKD